MRKLTTAERKATTQLYNSVVIVFAIIASIGLYGTMREAGIEPLRTALVCLTYGIGLHYILTTFMRGVFK